MTEVRDCIYNVPMTLSLASSWSMLGSNSMNSSLELKIMSGGKPG